MITTSIRRSAWCKDAVKLETLECVEWFNKRRLFELFGNRTPVEKEEEYYRNQEWAKVA